MNDELGATRDQEDQEKDPAEQEALARDIGEELTDLFVRYVQGDLDFAELTFATFDMLQDLHIIAGGNYELEYEEEDAAAPEGEVAEPYDREAATAEQEDLSQETART